MRSHQADQHVGKSPNLAIGAILLTRQQRDPEADTRLRSGKGHDAFSPLLVTMDAISCGMAMRWLQASAMSS
jgi:hypothetical protein